MKDDHLFLGMPYVSAKFVEEAETVKTLNRNRKGLSLGRVIRCFLEAAQRIL